MEESVSVVLYLAVVAAFEVLVLLSLFVSLYRKGCKELLNQIRQLLSSLYSLLGCGKTVKEQKINQGVQRFRLRISHSLMTLLSAEIFMVNVTLQLASLLPALSAKHLMTPPQMWTSFALLLLLSLTKLLPILRSSTLDVFYVLISILCVLFVSPWHIDKTFYLRYSLIALAFIRMPTVLLASRISVVVACNVLALLNISLRVSFEDLNAPELRMSAAIALGVEVMSFFGVISFGIFMNSLVRQRVESQLALDNMAEQLSAASSLLRLTCDAVIELDGKQRLTRHSPELATMLLIDRPGATLEGRSLMEFMPPEETARGRDFLTKLIPSESDDPCEPCITAHAFHTRLVDSAASKMQVEVFQVRFDTDDGTIHSLVGLRDFTDVTSLSGGNEHAQQDMLQATSFRHTELSIRSSGSELSPMRSTRSSQDSMMTAEDEVFNSKLMTLEIDMEGMVLHAASSALSSWVGKSVTEVFPSPHTVLLLERLAAESCEREDASEQERHGRVLAFQELPVKGAKISRITGTMRPMKNRYGRIHVLMAFSPCRTAERGSERRSRNQEFRALPIIPL